MANKLKHILTQCSKISKRTIFTGSRQLSGEFQFKQIHKPTGIFGSLTTVQSEDKQFHVEKATNIERRVSQSDPLVLIFGLAGATHKNLSKYSDVYRELGCDTLQYILPTRFIFKHSDQTHEAVEDVARYLRRRGVSSPLLIHCLSDTGVMTFQGLSIASMIHGAPFYPQGIVWDSCPGPRPKVTIPRGMVLCIINWLSRMRDGMSMVEAVRSSSDDFYHLAWRNYLRRLRGEETVISTMDNVWTGYWARDLNCHLHELFLYSKTDFYTPYKHLETEVIPVRQSKSKSLIVKRWDKSPHVGHLRAHKTEYKQNIEHFLINTGLIK